MDAHSCTESQRLPFGSGLDRYLLLFPAAVAALLSLPVLGFTYLWDDYNFLTNAMFYQLHDWAPDPTDPFYRPISRGVFFTLLDLAGRNGPLLGHLLNLGFFIAIVLFLASFTARIAGRKAGLLSGLIFAGLGAIPSAVGWTCCDQDLLAILFILAALRFRLEQRNSAALAATAAALLSKETSLAVIPVLVLFDWIVGRKPYRVWRSAGTYAALVAAWGAIHPAVRILVARGLRSGATGYVGLQHPEMWPVHIGRYLLTLFNVPAFDPLPGWPSFGILLLVVALVVMVGALRLAARLPRADADEGTMPPRSRVLLLGMILAAGPLILTSTMIRGWAPYYAAFPAVGFSMIAGVLLAASTYRAQVITMAAYLALGMWTRGNLKNPDETTESNHRVVSVALRTVESGFRRLYSAFPPGAQVILSVQARSPGGIYIHMYAFQTLRIWYRDRSVRTLRPEARTRTAGPEILAVIAPDRDVIDINLATLFARSASGKEPDYHVCETAIRAYAMGLAGSGDTDAAANLLLHMPEVNIGLETVHQRMAAMFFFAEGRDREAQAVLDSTVALPRGIAIADLQGVIAEQPPGRVFDTYALRAFGISPDDVDAIRDLMRWFGKMKYAEVALRFVERVEKLGHADRESDAIARKMRYLVEGKQNTPAGAADVE